MADCSCVSCVDCNQDSSSVNKGEVYERISSAQLPFSTGGNWGTVTTDANFSINYGKEQSLPEQLDQMLSVAEEIENRLESILSQGGVINPESDTPFGLSEKVKKLDSILAQVNALSLQIYNKVGVL